MRVSTFTTRSYLHLLVVANFFLARESGFTTGLEHKTSSRLDKLCHVFTPFLISVDSPYFTPTGEVRVLGG